MKINIPLLEHKAYNLRLLSLRSTTAAGAGHPTTCLSAADLVAALFFHRMQFDPHHPDNPHNDRFILSKGHAAPLLYAAWKEAGVVREKDLLTLRQFDSIFEGHPTLRFKQSEAATGSLGQGLSIGAGMALAAKMDGYTYKTYVLLGDSELSEGSVWEAAAIAAHYQLHNLVAILDVNNLGQSAHPIDGYHLDVYAKKFQAFGWHAVTVDGHDMKKIVASYDKAHRLSQKYKKPVIVIARTIKGYGIRAVEGKLGHHGQAFTKEQLPKILKELQRRFAHAAAYQGEDFKPSLPSRRAPGTGAVRHRPFALPRFDRSQPLATRKAYGYALKELGKKNKQVIVLDAEVKNSTFAEIFEAAFPDRFVQCFIAEQNMVGMAVGLTARGHVTFSSTFACFFSRAFDQLRMAAIGCVPLRLCGSHAGVSIGQDGPSQMGLEDIALMRSLPASVVLYPCDAISTYKLVECMAGYTRGISYLRTTRAATPIIYHPDEEFNVGGCKVLRESSNDHVCIIAAGITVFEALKAYEALKKQNIYVSVIDLYSIKPLDEQTVKAVVARSGNRVITVEDHYREGGLGEAVVFALRDVQVSIECLAVTKLPRSGKPEELLSYEEIDADAIAACVRKKF